MKVSSYTQYYIRKLLQQQADRLGYPHTGIGLRGCLQRDLTLILSQHYSPTELQGRIHELERLVELHRKVESAFQSGHSLTQIEQKIFWFLGLKFLALVSDLGLEVLPEAETARFVFLMEQQPQQAIRYQTCLYGQVLELGADYDLAACGLLFMLNSRQIPFRITASEAQHKIWIDLRSPAYLWLLKQNLGSSQVA